MDLAGVARIGDAGRGGRGLPRSLRSAGRCHAIPKHLELQLGSHGRWRIYQDMAIGQNPGT